MNGAQLSFLLKRGNFPCKCYQPELQETHISWVILCDRFVFKIKKPLKYSFLDFSSLKKRHYYCRQELILNRRLAKETYLRVVAVVEIDGKLEISLHKKANIIDYAVMMTRLDTNRRMDILLQQNQVTKRHIEQIAQTLYKFHKKAEVVYDADLTSIKKNFNDILAERDFISKQLGKEYGLMLKEAVLKSNVFIQEHQNIIKLRSKLGFIRDCHGDLHSRNIFLLKKPVIFDCIEFNPSIRRIDVLNELAFLCMDLEAFGHSQLSHYFMLCYSKLSKTIHNEQESNLFVYFKAYRANVRAKVNILRLKNSTAEECENALLAAKKYLKMMQSYIKKIG